MNEELQYLQDSYTKSKEIFPNIENNCIQDKIDLDYILLNFDDFCNKEINTHGRLIGHRNSKMFLAIRYKFYDIQCLFPNNKKNNNIKKILHIGDYIHVNGIVNYSNTGEKTIFINNLVILAKCLRNIPDQYYIQNKQEKYQLENRTMILTFNKNDYMTIYVRFEVIREIRLFLYKQQFIEADTPTLCKIYGGAIAKPFQTHYIVNKELFYLRIAPELYLKRLIVSGFPKIFEICHNFRNEGVSSMHNPEFTMLEVYEINIYLPDVINRALNLLKHIINFISSTYKQQINIDLENIKYRKFYDIIYEINPNIDNLDIDELIKFTNSLSLSVTSQNRYEIYDDIVSKYYIYKNYKDSIFVLTHHPKELSPLSKIKDNLALRFEIYLFGIEVIDGYEENNNSEKQYQIFREQEILYNRKSDMIFCNDLKIGMMQTCGYGMGIDRLLKILLDKNFIRDVIPFIE